MTGPKPLPLDVAPGWTVIGCPVCEAALAVPSGRPLAQLEHHSDGAHTVTLGLPLVEVVDLGEPEP